MEKMLFIVDSVADAVLTYNRNNMVVAVHSDTFCLTELKFRSESGGQFFLSTYERDSENNGAVFNIMKNIKKVVTSAAEAEIRALFINVRNTVPAILSVWGQQIFFSIFIFMPDLAWY